MKRTVLILLALAVYAPASAQTAAPKPAAKPAPALRYGDNAAAGRTFVHDGVRARNEIRNLVGEMTLQPENGVLIAEIKRAHVAGALITAAGGRQQMVVVAGACFGYFRRSVRIG